MGNCLALPVMHSCGYIDVTDRYYKAEGIERVGLDFPVRVCCVPGCRTEDIPGYRE